MTTQITLSVPDMSCGHCRDAISNALSEIGATASFDMEVRTVAVTGVATAQSAIAALDEVGFPAEPLAKG